MKRTLVWIVVVGLFILIYSKGLRTGNDRMFVTHDTSQPARIVEFIHNLEQGNIPPRISPEFSFRMGWPLYTMYAPFAYWIAALIKLITRLDIIDTLRMSYLTLLTTGLVGSFLFLRRHHSIAASCLGAALYASSSYIATNIFIRGALAESWYIAMLPVALWSISLAGAHRPRALYLITGYLCVGLFMMTHNSLAPLTLTLLFAYAAVQKRAMSAFVVLLLGVLMASYFLIPLIMQNKYTHAYEVSTKLKPETHFLCAWQLWDSDIGHGASVGGCDDDHMPFNVGKPQLLLFAASLGVCAIFFIKGKNRKSFLASGLFIAWSLSLLYMTLYSSSFIWKLFDKQLGLIQFPWRFIGVSLIGIAYIISQGTDLILSRSKTMWQTPMKIGIMGFALVILVYQSRFFINDQQTASVKDYMEFYFSKGALWDRMSYGYFELLPQSVDATTYERYSPYANPPARPHFYANGDTLPFEVAKGTMKVITNSSFKREAIITSGEGSIYVNIHAHPAWRIVIDSKDVSSWDFYTKGDVDKLGRPKITFFDRKEHKVTVYYAQTTIEVLSNMLSILSIGLVAYYVYITIHSTLSGKDSA